MQLERWLPEAQRPAWLLPRARHFFDTAMARGWDATHGGLVYGFGPDGTVCDGDKYFWVQAESFAAAALLAVRSGDVSYWQWYERIWAYAWQHFVDHEHGAWYRILAPDNRKLSDEKSPAGQKGVKEGDVIVEVAQDPAKTVEDVAASVEKVRKAGRKAVLLRVEDGKGDLRFLAVPLE